MKIKVDFTRLEKARKSMEADKANVGNLRDMRTSSDSPIEVRLKKEGQIILSADEVLKHIHYPGGLIAIGNTQITLHIYQPHRDKEDIPAGGPKFHVADCKTLRDMRQRGRYNRYIARYGVKEYFKVMPFNKIDKVWREEILTKLNVCMHCLRHLNYKHYTRESYNEQQEIVKHFSVEEFFTENKSFFRCLPLYTPENFPSGNYTASWSEISRCVRSDNGWQCDCCRVKLDDNRGLLHTHHKDGIRGNNKRSNLRPLCVLCHRKQPFHGRMHVKHREREKVIQIRKVQNIDRRCSGCDS